MAMPVANGAMLSCSFGMAPSTLSVPPMSRVTCGGQPMANVLDNKPFLNIAPFGLCSSLSNPVTAAQTSAALGVLTPGTCTPLIAAPWVPGSSTVHVASVPALNDSSVCMCAYGGVVQVSVSLVQTVQIP